MRLLARFFILFLLLILPACNQPTNHQTPTSPTLPANFDIQGHRGARGLKPENSLPAFETALDLQVTTLELDLHFTEDGQVVIWHDDHIENDKCGLDPNVNVETPDPDSLVKFGDGLLISRLTVNQVLAYRCDRNPDEGRFPDQDNAPTPLAGDHYNIITLERLFDFVELYAQAEGKTAAQRENAAHVQFNIETKRKPNKAKAIGDDFDGENAGSFELAILELVESRGLVDRVIIQSFDHRSLRAIRAENGEIRIAALTSGKMPAFSDLTVHNTTIWSPNAKDLNANNIANAQTMGLLVIPWTVNDPEDMQAFIDIGVDGLISDRPDLMPALGQ